MRRGTAFPETLVSRAAGLGYTHVALTDRDGLWALPRFLDACKGSGITPLIGAQLTDPETPARRVVALTRNLTAFRILSEIVSDRHLHEDFDPIEAVVSQADVGFILLADQPGILDELHGKIAPGRLFGELVWGERSATRRRFFAVMKKCRELKRPVTSSGNIYMADSEEYRIHAILTAMRAGRCLKDKLPMVDRGCILKPPDEFHAPYKAYNLQEAIINASEIASRCSWEFPGHIWHIPVPDGLPQGKRPIDHLRDMVVPRLKKKYKGWDGKTGAVAERLNMELDVIGRHGFAAFFLIVEDVVREAHYRGYRTLGRGSAGDSIVSYGLDITQVDPIRYDMYFERFLNPERSSPPDIDLDFSWKHRDEMVEYVEGKYGSDRVSSVGTVITLGLKSAFREVGKAMGYSNPEITRWSMYLPHHWEGDIYDLREHPVSKGLPIDEDPLRTILLYASQIQNLPIHQSVHVGGLVLSPSPISRFVPLNRAAKGFVITQYDMRDCEKVGLIKLDLLSQRGLGLLEDSLEMIARNGKTIEVDIDDVDTLSADPKIAPLFRTGNTIGCFDAESPMIRSLIKKLGNHSYDLHMIATALIRPGVSASGMMTEFIKRHRDPSIIRHVHPKMGEILKDTYGIIVFQEDVLKVLHQLAGVSLGEADLLRRMMSGKAYDGRQVKEELENKFIERCEERGIGSEAREKIWAQIESFSGYSFCKAHAAQFAILAYQCAYMKAHHTAEFFASRIANVGGYYPIDLYVRDARRFGMSVELPEVNRSEKSCVGRDDRVILGLENVGCLNETSIDAILLSRNVEGKFQSVADFLSRTGVGYEQTHALIRVGAFRSLNMSRPLLLGQLAEAFVMKIHRPKSARQPLLFPDTCDSDNKTSDTNISWTRDYSLYEQLQAEVDVLGMIVSIHPMEALKEYLEDSGFIEGKDMINHVGKYVRMGGILVSFKPVSTKKNHQPMALISLEDLSGAFDTVVFPEVYRKYAITLRANAGQGLCMEGKVELDNGAPTMVVEKAFPLQDFLREQGAGKNGSGKDGEAGITPMIFRRKHLQVDVPENSRDGEVLTL